MTSFCPLNQPQCKRTVMNTKDGFKKKECPLNVPKKCPWAPPVCPLVDSGEMNKCHLASTTQPKPKQKGCCCAPKPTEDRVHKCPPNRDLPPCVKCHQNEGKLCSDMQSVKLLQSSNAKKKRKRNTYKSRNTSNTGSNPTAEQSTNYELPNRDHLTLPKCITSSRRPMPCSACLLEIMKPSDVPKQEYDCSKVYKPEGPQPIKCPYMRVVDMCEPSCLCEDIPPIDPGPECPFLSLNCPCCPDPECPLNKVADCPLLQHPQQPTPAEGGSCKCCCPPVHNPCSFLAPEPTKKYLPVSGIVPRNDDGVPVTLEPGYKSNCPPRPPPKPCVCTPGTCPSQARKKIEQLGFDPNCHCQCEENCGCTPTPSQSKVTNPGPDNSPVSAPVDPAPSATSPGAAISTANPANEEKPGKGDAPLLVRKGDGYDIFKHKDKTYLLNYESKNCFRMGCECQVVCRCYAYQNVQ